MLFKLYWHENNLKLFSKRKSIVDEISSAQFQIFYYERKLAHNGCVLFSLLFGFVAKYLYHSIIYACVIHQRTKIYLDQIVSHTLDMQDFPCILYSLSFLIQVLVWGRKGISDYHTIKKNYFKIPLSITWELKFDLKCLYGLYLIYHLVWNFY